MLNQETKVNFTKKCFILFPIVLTTKSQKIENWIKQKSLYLKKTSLSFFLNFKTKLNLINNPN